MRDLTDHSTMPGVYRQLLTKLLQSDQSEINERTGTLIKTLYGGYSFKLDLSYGRVPVVGTRKLFPKTAAAEVAWFIQGSDQVDWLRKYTKIWDKFTEADGSTINGAYGKRWREWFGRDQLGLAVEALSLDPTNRRIWISAWDPATDGLGAQGQKNVPCPVGFSLSIVGGALHSTMVMRSSDVFVGLPYDVMGHSMLMQCLATTLNVKPGTLSVTLAHPHLYEPHFEMARTCVQSPLKMNAAKYIGPILQPFDIYEVERSPEDFVEAYAAESEECVWPDFNPRPELIL
jgi:thymidylate synthase